MTPCRPLKRGTLATSAVKTSAAGPGGSAAGASTSGARPGGFPPAGLKTGGFTLLEVMIALIIAGLAAAALLAAVGSGLHATQTASIYDQAIVRARSRLAAAVHGTSLAPGDWRGDDGGSFHWRLHVVRVASASLRPVGVVGPRAAKSVPVALYSVSVWIAWPDGGTERQVRLDTEQVGGAG